MTNNNFDYNEEAVDFQLLIDLADELDIEDDVPILTVIDRLAASGILMSKSVIKLGIAAGILSQNFQNEVDDE